MYNSHTNNVYTKFFYKIIISNEFVKYVEK